jgi:hypothetical protein
MGSLSPMSTRHLPVLSVATVVHCRCGQTEKEHLLLTTSTRRMHKTRCHAKSSRANAQGTSTSAVQNIEPPDAAQMPFAVSHFRIQMFELHV